MQAIIFLEKTHFFFNTDLIIIMKTRSIASCPQFFITTAPI